MYKPYSSAKVREQQLQNIYEVVLDEINSVMLDKEYVAWEDFNAEVAIVWRNQWYVVVVWGERGECDDEWYSIAIRPDGKEDEPGEIEGFYTQGKNPEEVKKALKRALSALDRYIDTGTTKVPPKKKYRKGTHILSLDERYMKVSLKWHQDRRKRGLDVLVEHRCRESGGRRRHKRKVRPQNPRRIKIKDRSKQFRGST